MQFRVFASIAIFAAGAMAVSTTSSASTAASSPVDLTAGIPTCALPCIESAVSASGCEATDTICLCTTGSKALLSAGTTCFLQNSDCSADDLQKIQILAKSRCGTLLSASGSGSPAASVSGSATAEAAAVSGPNSAAAASATSTSGAMQVGTSLMAVGAGALAFIL